MWSVLFPCCIILSLGRNLWGTITFIIKLPWGKLPVLPALHRFLIPLQSRMSTHLMRILQRTRQTLKFLALCISWVSTELRRRLTVQFQSCSLKPTQKSVTRCVGPTRLEMISFTENTKMSPSKPRRWHCDDFPLVMLISLGKHRHANSQVPRPCQCPHFLRGDKGPGKDTDLVQEVLTCASAETMQTMHALLVVYRRKAEGNGLISMWK